MLGVVDVPALAEIATEERLHEAWSHVLANDGADGRIAASIRKLERNLEPTLEQIRADLLAGAYRPAPLSQVWIDKSGGGTRELQIPGARDRVVERALTDVLAPILDRVFSPASFGYRAGMSVSDAVNRTTTIRDEGFAVVVRADVDDCFPTINRERLLSMLGALVSEPSVFALLQRLLERPVREGRRIVRRRLGIPQGSSLSPVLCNLYLTDTDLGLTEQGIPHVRFADDIVLFAPTRDEAQRALAVLERHLAKGGQRVGSDKLEIVDFDTGFMFLGEEFNARYPPTARHHRRDAPRNRSLFVGQQGASVRLSQGRLIVEHQQQEVLSVPTGHVARLVLSGSVGLSAGARSWALGTGVPVVLLSRRGNYLGALTSGQTPEAGLRRAQYALSGCDGFKLELARRFVYGKLSNLRTLLLRQNRKRSCEEVAEAARAIDFYRSQVANGETISEVLGIEGIASRAYWGGFGQLLPEEFGWDGRRRRPAPDVINAALGYGYAILAGEATAAAATAGLDPAAGFLHTDHERRPSLALDLMEELRPVIVDAAILKLIGRCELASDMHRPDDRRAGAVVLTEKARRRVVAAVEDRFLTLFKYIPADMRISYRRALLLQARAVVRSIRCEDPACYQPVLWR